MFNIVSCHRRLKDPTSDNRRSRISHKPNLILVDKLSTGNRADDSTSKLTPDEASRFHRIASSTAVSAEQAKAIGILINLPRLLYPLSLPDQALVIGGLARESLIDCDLRRLIIFPWFRCATFQAATWSRPVSAMCHCSLLLIIALGS